MIYNCEEIDPQVWRGLPLPPPLAGRCPLPNVSPMWRQGWCSPSVPVAFQLPRSRPARAEECEYDARHRLLLSDRVRELLGPECIEARPGYPTRAAAWLAGVDAAIRKRDAAEHELVAALVEAENAEFDTLIRGSVLATAYRRPHRINQGDGNRHRHSGLFEHSRVQRFGMVLRHALAVVVHQAESGLRHRITLVGGLAEPLQRFGIVLRHAIAGLIHPAEILLAPAHFLIGETKLIIEPAAIRQLEYDDAGAQPLLSSAQAILRLTLLASIVHLNACAGLARRI